MMLSSVSISSAPVKRKRLPAFFPDIKCRNRILQLQLLTERRFLISILKASDFWCLFVKSLVVAPAEGWAASRVLPKVTPNSALGTRECQAVYYTSTAPLVWNLQPVDWQTERLCLNLEWRCAWMYTAWGPFFWKLKVFVKYEKMFVSVHKWYCVLNKSIAAVLSIPHTNQCSDKCILLIYYHLILVEFYYAFHCCC